MKRKQNPDTASATMRVASTTLVVCALLWFLSQMGNSLLWAVSAVIVLGAIRPDLRPLSWPIALGALYGACLALALHLLADHFQLRYAWLYSSSALPAYLKMSNLWGGDEGTMLLLATFCMSIALGSATLPGWAGRGSALIAAWYVATAAWLGPFSATPADWLAAQPSQGMNAHLQTFWMAFHAPLVLAAYAWALAPAGAAIAALDDGGSLYGPVALRYSRRAWLVLTAGIGAGMAWAMEDFTFGQLWHWDPVQTAAFVVWALLGAVLHGAKRWRPSGTNRRLLPVLSLLAAAFACVAMSVTRSEVLASSHRYIGTTSWMSHLALAAVLIGLTLWHAGRRLSARTSTGQRRRSAAEWTLDLAIYLFAGAALLAIGALVQAHIHEWLGVEKPSEAKPFLETLLAWAGAEEVVAIRRAFDQWDVDGYALGRWLAPFLGVLGLVGGYAFLRRCASSRVAAVATFAMTLVVAFTVWHGGWLTAGYTGEGMLSQSVVAILPWLDGALLGGAFLMGACLVWGGVSLWQSRRMGLLRYTGGLALIHGGAVVALVGGLASTALNSYMPINIEPSTSPEQWHRVADGMQVRVLPDSTHENFSGYKAVARVELREGGKVIAGHALFQDSRGHPPAYQGPVRQLCEILDYHYARYESDRGYVLHPFIVRGWAQDLQVWVPASPRLMANGGKVDQAASDIQSVVVVRRFPFVSFVWVGLLAMLGGMLLLPGVAAAKGREQSVSHGLSQS
ncbi:cytochrome c biogenesis protein CcsA [Pseudomonas schmalbachii]|nr:cytochrome c biogenesis protein CcsA [Pseudomonas schmalbachii]